MADGQRELKLAKCKFFSSVEQFFIKCCKRSPEMKIYLDHNATSPLRPEVVDKLQSVLSSTSLANPSSVHGSGRGIRKYIEDARQHVAKLIDAKPDEIIFTSGGTEANHIAWTFFQKMNTRILSTSIEHSSVISAQKKAESCGATVDLLNFDSSGNLQTKPHDQSYSFISVQHANNETGQLLPWKDILTNYTDENTYIHTDAVQSIGKLHLGAEKLGAHMLSMSGHKIGAPAGVGALYVKKSSPFKGIWDGGSQERGQRPGTENALGIIAMGEACKVVTEKADLESKKIEAMRNNFEEGLLSKITDCHVVAKDQPRLPNTSSIIFDGVPSESLMIAADLDGLECSAGSACSSGSLKPSRVLLEMGFSDTQARSALRFSLGWNTTSKDMENAVHILAERVKKIRTVGLSKVS